MTGALRLLPTARYAPLRVRLLQLLQVCVSRVFPVYFPCVSLTPVAAETLPVLDTAAPFPTRKNLFPSTQTHHLHLPSCEDRRLQLPVDLPINRSSFFPLVATPQRLAAATGAYMPIAPLALELLAFSELARPPVSSGGKPADLSVALKVPKQDMRAPEFQASGTQNLPDPPVPIADLPRSSPCRSRARADAALALC